ncbi:MAG TPA: hypothetical protein VK489_00450 [Ferruginibacter sp.]|nr:hypothetical protein [Ferruginibacter sp.]
MRLLQKLLTKLNGLHYTQEYLCFAKESLSQPLHVYLVNDKCVIKDITNQHAFVGYSPLVLAFPSLPGIVFPLSLRLIFSARVLQPNEYFLKKDALATLELRIIEEQLAGTQGAGRDNKIFFYEGVHGAHHFLSGFHQFIGRLNNDLYNKKPGNVFLHNNLYEQVKIAYAVPRGISLITVGKNDQFNLFPTDLHGQPDEDHYIISLRIGGKACEQVEAMGKLVISQVHSDACKMVYGLGKNHMQELRSKDNFPFSGRLSENFKWPLPEQALSYRELILLDSFTYGIHRILLFRIGFQQQPGAQTGTLAHIHNSFATWRYKNRLPGNYLLR